MSHPRQVVVTGATGQQGGAVARALLARSIPVRALVRAPESPAAVQLRRLGVELVVGRFEEPTSLDRALAGADALFAVTTPFEGVAAEAQKGIALVDAARRAGLAHVVYTSACHADRSTAIPSFESKQRIEQHLRASGVPFTIVAPVYFMENLLTPFSLARLREGQYARFMPLSKGLQLIAVEDIGRFCAWVFEHRQAVLGQRIDIAGDELEGPQAAAILSRVMGRPVEARALSLDGFPADGDLGQNTAALLAWLARDGFHADIPRLYREYPEVGWHTFARWAEQQDLAARTA